MGLLDLFGVLFQALPLGNIIDVYKNNTNEVNSSIRLTQHYCNWATKDLTTYGNLLHSLKVWPCPVGTKIVSTKMVDYHNTNEIVLSTPCTIIQRAEIFIYEE